MNLILANVLVIIALILAVVFLVHPGPVALLAVGIILLCAASLAYGNRKG